MSKKFHNDAFAQFSAPGLEQSYSISVFKEARGGAERKAPAVCLVDHPGSFGRRAFCRPRSFACTAAAFAVSAGLVGGRSETLAFAVPAFAVGARTENWD